MPSGRQPLPRDETGRRLFRSELQAFRAQRRLYLDRGIMSGIIRRSDGMLVILHDPTENG